MRVTNVGPGLFSLLCSSSLVVPLCVPDSSAYLTIIPRLYNGLRTVFRTGTYTTLMDHIISHFFLCSVLIYLFSITFCVLTSVFCTACLQYSLFSACIPINCCGSGSGGSGIVFGQIGSQSRIIVSDPETGSDLFDKNLNNILKIYIRSVDQLLFESINIT